MFSSILFRNSRFSDTQLFCVARSKSIFSQSIVIRLIFFFKTKIMIHVEDGLYPIETFEKQNCAAKNLTHKCDKKYATVCKYLNEILLKMIQTHWHTYTSGILEITERIHTDVYTERHVKIKIRLLWFLKMIACCSGWQ